MDTTPPDDRGQEGAEGHRGTVAGRLDEAIEREVLDALTETFTNEGDAEYVARRAGFPPRSLRPFNRAYTFWAHVMEDARHGVMPTGGQQSIVDVAAILRPCHPVFKRYKSPDRSGTVDPPGDKTLTFGLDPSKWLRIAGAITLAASIVVLTDDSSSPRSVAASDSVGNDATSRVTSHLDHLEPQSSTVPDSPTITTELPRAPTPPGSHLSKKTRNPSKKPRQLDSASEVPTDLDASTGTDAAPAKPRQCRAIPKNLNISMVNRLVKDELQRHPDSEFSRRAEPIYEFHASGLKLETMLERLLIQECEATKPDPLPKDPNSVWTIAVPNIWCGCQH